MAWCESLMKEVFGGVVPGLVVCASKRHSQGCCSLSPGISEPWERQTFQDQDPRFQSTKNMEYMKR